MRKFIFLLFIIIVCFVLYGIYINTSGLIANEYFIESDKIPESFDGFKILHITDILYDEKTNPNQLDLIVTKVNELKPDIIVFTGDLFNKDYKPNKKDIKKITGMLKKLDSSLYKYAIIGNNDQKQIDTYKEIISDSNFDLLDNSYEYLFYKDTNPIKLIGLTDLNAIDELLLNEENITPCYTIAFTHYSDNFKTIKEYDIDLTLSGNSLGGQIRIPFVGGIIKKKGSKIYIDEYYEENNKKLYVSYGIGTEKYHIRTLNTPSINLYRLNAK